MNKHEEAIQKLDFMNDEYNKVLEQYNLSGGFGNWYLGVKRTLKEAEATEKELERLQKIESLYKDKALLIMCKHEELDVDFSAKTPECFVDILNNDDTCYNEETDTYDYEAQNEKDVEFFDGATVQYAEYKCYLRKLDWSEKK